ncbi:catechol 2,3-dioxygenase-like lactoylglutathione lyase family enzyme [Sphingobium xenophagum]|uniref:Catechol 2,3-dioxygenase-like lactoylglutathione lyase family enzyme n=1 Tax=Sphingobium xenophagum TaxID=121428 RepID=A0ABU1X6A8_SPHXE|nr:VOC family protein [Sphingobium xenophagum]MDR7157105.1 catechol 2,3-dioxygenase-like lactoylglutathione lyase family enzyme [Sphingobium xenophagum]
MAIIGIERLIYCVDDLVRASRFFEDFGLNIYQQDSATTKFELPDNSRVILRSRAADPVPASQVIGPGVHQVVWGVDTKEHLDRIVDRVAIDREVTVEADGIHRFVADGGIVMGLRHWHEKQRVVTSVDPINSPGNIKRMNVHRKWISRARPKYLCHVVYAVPDYKECIRFMIDRLGFTLSDKQRDLGMYLRCDGTTDHHNFFVLNARAPFPGNDGQLRFHHTNFTVTDLDEIMIGKNHMERCGWESASAGLGRHRIASALFLYFDCPAGGEAEYGADADAIDASWVPRDFHIPFGLAHWMHHMPDFWRAGPEWEVAFADGGPKPSQAIAAAHDTQRSFPSSEVDVDTVA